MFVCFERLEQSHQLLDFISGKFGENDVTDAPSSDVGSARRTSRVSFERFRRSLVPDAISDEILAELAADESRSSDSALNLLSLSCSHSNVNMCWFFR